jgi:hypothetical protein
MQQPWLCRLLLIVIEGVPADAHGRFVYRI